MVGWCPCSLLTTEASVPPQPGECGGSNTAGLGWYSPRLDPVPSRDAPSRLPATLLGCPGHMERAHGSGGQPQLMSQSTAGLKPQSYKRMNLQMILAPSFCPGGDPRPVDGGQSPRCALFELLAHRINEHDEYCKSLSFRVVCYTAVITEHHSN